MELTGLVGWRGMVGSVLMDRMKAEKDFALIEPMFFTTSQRRRRGARRARRTTPAEGRHDVDALRRWT